MRACADPAGARRINIASDLSANLGAYNHGGAPLRVIQTIIRDSGNTQWPVLMKTNYVEWSSMMKVKLEARRMWNIVHLGGTSRHEDQQAPEVLLSAIPPEMVPALSGKPTAKDAWDVIATMPLP
jgi:hypothetical protein